MTGALWLGSLACGETERNEQAPLPTQSGSNSGGQITNGGTSTTETGGAAAGTAQAASGTAGTSADTGGNAGASTTKPTPVTAPITQVVKSSGCGKQYAGPTSGATNTLQTMGVKAADCAGQLAGQPICGSWAATRTYNLYLPQNYDPTKAYALVIEAPGCSGTGSNVPALNHNVDNSAIRVGVAPGPNDLGHGSNPNQGCFDDHEGDDSIDWVMYEQLYDRLDAELCFDRNRVFVGGYGSGAWFANELGCKYAGDLLRPVRAVLPNAGALPTDPRFAPTCSNAPLAGFWVHEVTSFTTPFEDAKVAIERAMALNSCASGSSYDTAPAELFPIGGGTPETQCKRITGCSPLYPIVVCPLPNRTQSSNESIVNPGWSTFIKLFQSPPLITY